MDNEISKQAPMEPKQQEPYCGKCGEKMYVAEHYIVCRSGKCQYPQTIACMLTALVRAQLTGILIFK